MWKYETRHLSSLRRTRTADSIAVLILDGRHRMYSSPVHFLRKVFKANNMSLDHP
jgi:hypothetical protein